AASRRSFDACAVCRSLDPRGSRQGKVSRLRAMRLSRRDWLRLFGLAPVGWAGSRSKQLLTSLGAGSQLAGDGTNAGKGLFEQVPSAASGITWKHTNGRSPEYYLPETTGAGCAFLDYDNDGWMDIYLVNSGKCDFYE